jgi:hypothetical protein
MPTGAHDPHMGTNERRLDMLEKRARDALSEAAERDARRIVAIWNGRRAKGRELWFHLRIGAAIAAIRGCLSFVQAAGRSARLICARLIVIPTRRLNRWSSRSVAGDVSQTRHL